MGRREGETGLPGGCPVSLPTLSQAPTSAGPGPLCPAGCVIAWTFGNTPFHWHGQSKPVLTLPYPELQLSPRHSLSCGPNLHALIPVALAVAPPDPRDGAESLVTDKVCSAQPPPAEILPGPIPALRIGSNSPGEKSPTTASPWGGG